MPEWTRSYDGAHVILDCSCGAKDCILPPEVDKHYTGGRGHTFMLNILLLFTAFAETFNPRYRGISLEFLEGKHITIKCGNGHEYDLVWDKELARCQYEYYDPKHIIG